MEKSETGFPARIGLRWGGLFWLPVLLLAILAGTLEFLAEAKKGPSPRPIVAWVFCFAAFMLPAHLLAGRWWAKRGQGRGEWAFLLAAMAHGFALLLSLVLPLAALKIWIDGAHAVATPPLPVIGAAVVVWGVFSVWMLALGTVIEWRVRRGMDVTTQAADPPNAAVHPAHTTHLRRFAMMLVPSFGVPALLCAPFVLMLYYDIGLRRSANAILSNEINAIAPRIADLRDMERVKSSLLARKQIVEHLETTAPGNVLAVFGHMPNGVQLTRLEMKAKHLTLALRAEPSAERSVLELLAQNGFRDPQIAARPEQDDDAIEQVTIEADWMRGEVEQK